MRNSLTSHSLYLESQPGQVLKTQELTDTNAGIYPCYYVAKNDYLLVANSVVTLIKYLGNLSVNENFRPPNYLDKSRILEQIKTHFYPKISNIRGMTWLFSHFPLPENRYETWETIDQRIFKLKPFEKITPKSQENTLSPEFSLEKENLIQESAAHLKSYVNEIERRFPDKEQVVLMGGMDSMLMGLVPKLNPEKWHVFSSTPNYALVKQFIKKNRLHFQNIFHTKNQNDKSLNFLKEKFLATDLYADPSHLKWRKRLRDLNNHFEKGCIFWEGSAGQSLYKYVPYFHQAPESFFKKHFSKFPTFQGATHQSTKLLTGAPLLSPYHSFGIWKNAYLRFNPAKMNEEDDLRPALGETLAHKAIWFPERNPGPNNINYASFRQKHPKTLYKQKIERILRDG